MPLPLMSSGAVIAILVAHFGCDVTRPAKKGHQMIRRPIGDPKDKVTKCGSLPANRREVARGTLRSCLRQLGIEDDEFNDAANS